MYLKHLSLTNYRAFTRLDMDLPRRILLLVGDNAQGKTSLLEAVFYLAVFSSFHSQSDRQLINFIASEEPLAVARIVADFDRADRAHHLEVRLIQEPNGGGTPRFRKEILLDGIRKTTQQALGTFNAVIFLPQMMRIMEGGPDERRRYLNIALSQVLPGYAGALSRYAQAMTQRNALLRQISERGGDRGQLLYWDDSLTLWGSQIIAARIRAVNEIEQIAGEIHRRLTHSQEILRFLYQPSFDPLPLPNGQLALPITASEDRLQFSQEEIRQGFQQRLAAVRSEEIARGVTTLGPHRDELRFLGNDIDLGQYGSRGQARTALLSLKLAEVAWMKKKTGFWPVVLLDEILAELDAHRRSDLLAYLAEGQQAVLTTTDLNLFESHFTHACTVWHVQSGRIQSVVPESDSQNSAEKDSSEG